MLHDQIPDVYCLSAKNTVDCETYLACVDDMARIFHGSWITVGHGTLKRL